MPALGIEPITAIAIGTLLGGVAQLAIAVAAAAPRGLPLSADDRLARSGAAPCPGADGAGHDRAWPRRRSTCSSTRCWPPGEGTGAVSWLNYAFRLMYLPIGLFGVSIATAMLPAVSRQAAQHDDDGVRRHGGRRPVADADAERAGDGRPDGPGDADRPTHLRAARLHRRTTPAPPPRRCSSTRSAWSATRSCASCRRPSTRSARTASRSWSASRQCCSTPRSTSCWCACSAIAGWRSARRSLRCSTRRCCSTCCGVVSAG